MKRLLIIASHLSTGGLPQVVLKRVELLMKDCEVYVMEYRQLAWKYVVQRNKIIELLGDNFISLGRHETEEKRDKFEYYFKSIKADIVHMEEIPEMFMRDEHADIVYSKDRTYKLFETTHTSTFNINNKKYFPDKFLFVSEYSKEEYSKFNIPSEVINYPIDKIEKQRDKYIEELDLDPNYFHVLNVGLFTQGKNQGHIFKMAEKMQNYKIQFHFIGNQAGNFEDYWEPLNNLKLDNCRVWGERDDVEKFYHACDLLLFPSVLELNPLVVKEALTYEMPIFMNRLPVLRNIYDNDYLITYLTGDYESDILLLLEKFNIRKKYTDSEAFKQLMLNNYGKSKISKEIDYKIDFVDGAKVQLIGDGDEEFNIEFINNGTNIVEYSTNLSLNQWSKTISRHYKNWRVVIKKDDNIIVDHKLNLEGKNVHIQFDSKSLGDSLAFVPYVEEFRKKHNCIVYCSTFWNNLYEKEYKNINFIKPGESINKEIYAKYYIGWFQPWRNIHNPNDYKKIPLQQTITDILGLEFKEIVPKITIKDGQRPIEDKYVCIAQFSTANAKHWHYPYKNSQLGWQMIVDWLNMQGYKVMVISKQSTNLKNIINKTGNFPIEHRINEIKHCEFFIGIGSGLSWLAWALGKKVVMISGFSDPLCEFKSNNIRIHNKTVCNSCFNRYEFDKGDWNWCPDHKNTERHFECSLNITPDMIIDEIKKNELVEEKNKLNFSDYFIKADDINLEIEKLVYKYNEEENKLMLTYKEGTTPELNIDIADADTEVIYQTLNDVVISDKHIIWATPNVSLKDRSLSLRFYKEKTILKINL